MSILSHNFFLALTNIVFPIVVEFILIYCGSFFAATETAFTSLSRVSVRQIQKEGKKNSGIVVSLRSNLERLISTMLVGTNFVTTLISSIATSFSISVFGAEKVSYGTAIISILVIIFSEIVPKTYAGAEPKAVALKNAPHVVIIQKIMFPVVYLCDKLTCFINFLESLLIKQKKPLLTEEELRTLLEVGEREGTLDESEKNMLNRIFDFSDLRLGDIMRHRSLIKYVSIDSTLETVISAFGISGYSRLPVYKGSPENVVGVLHYKAVLFASKEITNSRDFVRICMTETIFVPKTMSAVELLQRFKKERCNFAVVVNEYGESAGVVTLDDLLREVFGRITDEYGMVEVSPEKLVTLSGPNEFLVPGDMRLDDLNSVLKLNLDSDYYDTLGGWLLEHFDELPPVGAVYRYKNIIFIVEDQSARRIQSVRIRLS